MSEAFSEVEVDLNEIETELSLPPDEWIARILA